MKVAGLLFQKVVLLFPIFLVVFIQEVQRVCTEFFLWCMDFSRPGVWGQLGLMGETGLVSRVGAFKISGPLVHTDHIVLVVCLCIHILPPHCYNL